MQKTFEQKHALLVFLLIVFAITIPLTLLIRAKMDRDRASRPVQSDVSSQTGDDVSVKDGLMIETPDQEPDQTVYQGFQPEPNDMDEDARRCEAAGGHWNPCGSACRNAGADTFCIEVCITQCECGGVDAWTCPFGTTCEEYEPLPRTAASVGVCR